MTHYRRAGSKNCMQGKRARVGEHAIAAGWSGRVVHAHGGEGFFAS